MAESGVEAGFGARLRVLFGLLQTPLSHEWAELAAVAVLCPILLAVAIWNGFPIIYYDTGAYLLEGLGHDFLIERSPVYSQFLFFAGGAWSLWLIAIIQAAMTAFVMTETVRMVAPHMRLRTFLALGAVLVVATGLPWYVGQIEPDCLTAVVVLSTYLLAFHAPALGRGRCVALIAIGGFAIGAHPSHLVLAAGIVLALLCCRGLVRLSKSGAWTKPDARPAALCFGIGLGLIVASNFGLTGEVFVTRAGPAFLFSRILQDGIVMRLLDDTCPGSGYKLCAYKDELPPTADGWLWGRDSPFQKLNGFEGTTAESERMIWDSLKRYPLLHVEDALADAGRQFVTFKTGDQIEPQEWALKYSFERFVPGQMPAYLNARQQRGEIHFRTINLIDIPVAGLALAGLAAMLFYTFTRRHRNSALFLAFILTALAGNAFICGALSNPHARYQSRLVWLAPFALALTARDGIRRR
jgi:hypothetical protein